MRSSIFSHRCLSLPLLALVATALFQSSCQWNHVQLTASGLSEALPSDQRAYASISSANTSLQRSFIKLRDQGSWKKAGYFTAEESDRLEHLLFRFHTAHQHLSDIVQRYGKLPANLADREGAERLCARANRLALEQSHFLVTTFAGDPIAIAKLNQRYPRTEVPSNTYDHLVQSLQSPVKRGVAAAKLNVVDGLDTAAYLAQAELFYRVSRLKSPRSHLISFSTAQKQEVLSMLQPGDILLTYTAGYASDVFIPGAFKHAITFMGSPEQRKAAGLSADHIRNLGESSRGDMLAKKMRQQKTDQDRPANLIEAVAEGVKFSNLEWIMDTHINRLLVLRPNLDSIDRGKQLSRTFSYLGNDYDFRFDFADSSRQVCTEVIYRSINGLNGVEFELTRRGGHLTLSADDLVNYWLKVHPESFEFILFAEEAPLSITHQAQIHTGATGKLRLEKLMTSGGND